MFFGLSRTRKDHDRITSAKSIVLTKLCMKKGLAVTYEDLVQPMVNFSHDLPPESHLSHVAAQRKAKSTWAQIQAKTKSNLFGITSLNLCCEHVSRKRIIYAGSGGTFSFYNEVQDVKSPKESLQFHVDMAEWKWLKVNKATWKVLLDTRQLEHIGITCSFSGQIVKMTQAELQARVRYESCLTNILGTCCQRMSSNMTGSFLEYVENPPLKYAGLAYPTDNTLTDVELVADREEVQDLKNKIIDSAMEELKKDTEALHYGMRSPDPRIRNVAEDSAFTRPFNQWLIAFGIASDYKFIPRQTRLMLRRFIMGLTQSMGNEQLHKRLKETVLREAPSKLIRGVRCYNECFNSKVFATYKRDATVASSMANPPSDPEVDKLFRKWTPSHTPETLTEAQAEQQKRFVAFKKELQSLIGAANSFATFNPTSQQQRFAEWVCLRILSGSGLPRSHFADAWRSGLMIEGSVVVNTTSERYYIVEKAYNRACVLWPAKKFGLKLYTKDLTVTTLDWEMIWTLVGITFQTVKRL
jgi:hypothetical protein